MTEHLCHWPGCKRPVPPARWGCRQHWFTLPTSVRMRISVAYVPGQEIKKNPSADYLAAARGAQDWITKHLAKKQSSAKAARRATGAELRKSVTAIDDQGSTP